MKIIKLFSWLFIVGLFFQHCTTENKEEADPRKVWTTEQAKSWYAGQGWLVGCNYIPANAINQLEMWQEETFDSVTIDKELGWAAAIGMNTVRVYLHDLLWKQDSTGFLNRMETFIQIAAKHNIKPLFVFFDSCWDPFPKTGTQREPKPHLHNSGWVQSPGYDGLVNKEGYPDLERYVKGVTRHFANDNRILGWDIWNEPDNTNTSSYGSVELENKVDYVLPLLEQAFEWARSENPDQPLTSAIWLGDWSDTAKLKPIEKLQVYQSDIISFHNYDSAHEFEKRIEWLQPYNRPIICTEYMARGNGSYFEGSLPIAKKYNVGAYNWGLVDGKTQTKYAWDTWKKTYTSAPDLWFHEVFQADGTPYREEETTLIKQLTSE